MSLPSLTMPQLSDLHARLPCRLSPVTHQPHSLTHYLPPPTHPATTHSLHSLLQPAAVRGPVASSCQLCPVAGSQLAASRFPPTPPLLDWGQERPVPGEAGTSTRRGCSGRYQRPAGLQPVGTTRGQAIVLLHSLHALPF